jgi:hypothetical protein
MSRQKVTTKKRLPRKISPVSLAAKSKKAKKKCKKMCTILFLLYIPSARGIRPHTVPIEAAASLNSRRMRVWNHQTTRARSRRRQAIWTRYFYLRHPRH